ncbi:MAG TPA: AraC family transcriptional regulator [Polyangiaceae bacterium]|nr:AraC family transcriptional regulator [Polyangiaceae bacterium]
MPSLRAQFMVREIDAAGVVDVPARRLCAHVGMDLARLDDPLAVVPLRQIAAVYGEAAARSGDEDLGLHVGERCGARMVDVVDYALISRPTLAKAYDELRPLAAVLYPEGEIGLSVRDDVAFFSYRMEARDVQSHRHRCEALLAGLMKLAQRALAASDAPTSVAFQHAKPRVVSEHARVFGCPVRFGWAANELAFPARWLEMPLATADANLAAVLDRHLADLFARMPSDRAFAHDVRRRLLRAFRPGAVGLPAVAKNLGVSERTLQRRLKEEGTSLQELTESVRYELSLVMLKSVELSLGEIAQRLGYASQAAFSRAFRRWRGMSPAAHRRAETRPDPPAPDA